MAVSAQREGLAGQALGERGSPGPELALRTYMSLHCSVLLPSAPPREQVFLKQRSRASGHPSRTAECGRVGYGRAPRPGHEDIQNWVTLHGGASCALWGRGHGGSYASAKFVVGTGPALSRDPGSRMFCSPTLEVCAPSLGARPPPRVAKNTLVAGPELPWGNCHPEAARGAPTGVWAPGRPPTSKASQPGAHRPGLPRRVLSAQARMKCHRQPLCSKALSLCPCLNSKPCGGGRPLTVTHGRGIRNASATCGGWSALSRCESGGLRETGCQSCGQAPAAEEGPV